MLILINILLIVFLIGCSAFFAGTETGVYRLSRIRLRIGCEKNKPSYKTLFKLIKDGEGLVLSLLLGNNLVNYLATTLVTLLFVQAVDSSHQAEVLTTCVMTPVLFIFGEIIPKNLYYYRADALLPATSKLLWIIDRIFTVCGAKWLLRFLARILSSCLGLRTDSARAVDMTQRHQVRQIIHETQEEGMLSEAQKEMMSRLIDIPTVSAGAVMVPMKQVEKISLHIGRDELVESLARSRYTRQLVYDKDPGDIAGYVTIYDLMGAVDSFEGIESFITPLTTIDRNTSVIECMNILRNKHERFALIVETIHGQQRPAGIITIADLVEEITGELNT